VRSSIIEPFDKKDNVRRQIHVQLPPKGCAEAIDGRVRRPSRRGAPCDDDG
jgi:hypothetical protein